MNFLNVFEFICKDIQRALKFQNRNVYIDDYACSMVSNNKRSFVCNFASLFSLTLLHQMHCVSATSYICVCRWFDKRQSCEFALEMAAWRSRITPLHSGAVGCSHDSPAADVSCVARYHCMHLVHILPNVLSMPVIFHR